MMKFVEEVNYVLCVGMCFSPFFHCPLMILFDVQILGVDDEDDDDGAAKL